MGYEFKVLAYHHDTQTQSARVVVKNTGVAPAYYDMYVAVGGRRATESLRKLQPGKTESYFVSGVGTAGEVSIECDQLLPGQRIQYTAHTTGNEPF